VRRGGSTETGMVFPVTPRKSTPPGSGIGGGGSEGSLTPPASAVEELKVALLKHGVDVRQAFSMFDINGDGVRPNFSSARPAAAADPAMGHTTRAHAHTRSHPPTYPPGVSNRARLRLRTAGAVPL
jgi:hypothetical protein